MTPSGRGRLIVLEGGEASGKTTQAGLLAERLGALATREPGGTALGRRLRELLLDPASPPVGARAEALLLAADRAQHVAEVIEPALATGRHVVSERFSGSTLAYQGHGRGLPAQALASLGQFATGGLEADVVVLLDVPPTVASARRPGARDRFEAAGEEFHHRVREGYGALAKAEPGRWVTIDGARPVGEVAERVWEAVRYRTASP